jgi:hypothetical protein
MTDITFLTGSYDLLSFCFYSFFLDNLVLDHYSLDEDEYENYEVDLEESINKKLDKPSRKTFQFKFSVAL